MTIEGVELKVVGLDDFTEKEAQKYIDYVKDRVEEPLQSIEVKLCEDGKIDVDYTLQGEKFERIRRITGYLTGDVTSWNNSKRAEESQRVKHNVLV